MARSPRIVEKPLVSSSTIIYSIHGPRWPWYGSAANHLASDVSHVRISPATSMKSDGRRRLPLLPEHCWWDSCTSSSHVCLINHVKLWFVNEKLPLWQVKLREVPGFSCSLEFKSCRRKIKLLLLVTPPDSTGTKDPKRGSNCLLTSKWGWKTIRS